MPTYSQTLAQKLEAKRKELAEFFSARKTTDQERPYNFTAEDVDRVRAMSAELDEAAKEWKAARDIEEASTKVDTIDVMLRSTHQNPLKHDGRSFKTIGESFVELAYGHKNITVEAKDVDALQFKATMTTSSGFAPVDRRSDMVTLFPTRPIRVIDILPTIQMDVDTSYVYMEETTFTNAATEVAEAPASPWGEATLTYTERTAPIRKIGVWLPVSDEQLSDVVGIRDLIDNRLETMLMLRLDTQVLQGNGTAPNINGFYNQVTQTEARGSNPVFDAIFRGMIKASHVGFGTVTAVVLHPNDWQDIRLTRTTEGVYILGNPDTAQPERLFGVPVVVTTAALENTGLVGDFLAHSALVYRQGVELQVSNSHSDFFARGLQAIRASLRAALVVFRPSAFCEITGI